MACKGPRPGGPAHLPAADGRAVQEVAFSAACLQHDAKNYHAWAHRQAVLLALAGSSGGVCGAPSAAQQAQARALWANELAFTERMLRQDVRNNSGGSGMPAGEANMRAAAPAWPCAVHPPPPPGIYLLGQSSGQPSACVGWLRLAPWHRHWHLLVPAAPAPGGFRLLELHPGAPVLQAHAPCRPAHVCLHAASRPAAWNQRIFVLRNAPPSVAGPPPEAYDREVDFATRQLHAVPHNESGWEALRALAAGPGAPDRALAADPRYLQLCREVLGGAEDGGGSGLPGCAPALSLLADVLLEQAALLQGAAALLQVSSASSDSGQDGDAPAAEAPTLSLDAVETAAAAARRLAVQALERQLAVDPIKRTYLRLELAAVEAALRGAAARGAKAARAR